MPLYEYKCTTCGDVFEVIQKFSDEPLTVHEKCGGEVERLISAAALQFKGSGWYVTDYGKGSSKEAKPKTDASNGSSKGEKANGSSKAAEPSSKSETSSKADSSPSAASSPSASKPESK
jgi:putative FmdB family regulatory protein